MKKIIAFGASSSKQSINKQLAAHAAKQSSFEYLLLDLNEFEMPLYSIDKENNQGFPQEAQIFHQLIKDADGIIISFAEHNGAVTAAYKNLHDWISRMDRTAWSNKNMLLLSTSPGQGGASRALEYAKRSFGISKALISGSFSLPSFYENFNVDNGITKPELQQEFKQQVEAFTKLVEAPKEQLV